MADMKPRLRSAPLAALAFAIVIGAAQRVAAQTPVVPPAPQNPSPMVEQTRAHVRIPQQEPPGTRRSFTGPLDKPVQVFVPLGAERERSVRLVIHFHGASFIPEVAVSRLGKRYVAATVNLAPGSGIYDRTFSDSAAYDSLLASIKREVSGTFGHDVRFDHVVLVGFSAGHGAIRAILRDPRHLAAVRAVVLLDGLHTSYVPEGTVLEKGGTLDETKLAELLTFAQAAIRGEKRFLITHSEIFPGTFASTTETTNYLVSRLGLRRTPVLRWGPGGMQQLSEVRNGQFEIMGFAGNSGPDHIDHFHGLPEFIRRVEQR